MPVVRRDVGDAEVGIEIGLLRRLIVGIERAGGIVIGRPDGAERRCVERRKLGDGVACLRRKARVPKLGTA